MKQFVFFLLGILPCSLLTVPASAAPDAPALYGKHCAECHGPERLGATGPALLPLNLGRLKPGQAQKIIAEGRPATQMSGFGESLTADEIKALADWVFTPPEKEPVWGASEINASHVVHIDPASLPNHPTHTYNLMNLFSVVESGDHHVTILDGDRIEPIARFASRFALHGGIKYSPDGRFAYMASRDGWVSMYDLWSLQMVAEIRAGINARNIAVSGDGQWLAVGNMLPGDVVILDAQNLALIKVIPTVGPDNTVSRVSAVYTAPPRNSFIVALKDIPEVWEVPYGMVHADESGMVEAPNLQESAFSVRRIRLDDYLDDFFFDQSYTHIIGAARNSKNGQVVHLTEGRKIADMDLTGMPHLGSGITFDWQGRRMMATPHLREGKISVIDLETFKTVKTIETKGPGFFLRSHANSPYIWADVFFGPNKDVMHVIDKATLNIVKTLRPAPGKTVAHVEFTQDGGQALVSVMENDGELIIYNAQTLEEEKRLPMRRPVGKYNVANKIHYEEGTSH